METVIRQATIDDRLAIWDFIKVAYGDHAKDKIPDRWIWEFLENPLTDKKQKFLPIFIAIQNDCIVGKLCAIQSYMKIGEEIHRAVAGCDLMVLPECRGQGLAQRLIQAVVDHYQIYLAIAFAKATRRIYYRMDSLRLEPLPTYLRFQKIDPESVSYFLLSRTANHLWMRRIASFGCHLWADKVISVFVNFLIAIRDILTCKRKKDFRSDIKEIDRFDDNIDKLWNNINSKFKIITKRDQLFLNWRFSDSPHLDYRKFVCSSHGELKGYMVVRIPDRIELNIGIIADLFAEPDDFQTIEDLIQHAIHFFDKSVIFIECPTTQPEYQKALLKLGFLKIKKNLPIAFCKDERLKTNLEKWKKSWFISKADEDWDQLHPK